MALMTQRSVGLVALMALRAFEVTCFGDVVLMRIFFEVFRSLGDSLDRLVAGEACCRRRRGFGLFFAMAGVARETPCPMAVRGEGVRLLGDNRSGPKQNYCRGNAKKPFSHGCYLFLG